MIAAWMVYALLVSALVAGAAAGLDAVFRLAALPVRWVWAGALLLTLSLVALAPARTPPAPLRMKAPLVEARVTGGAVALPERTFAAALTDAGSVAVRRVRGVLLEAGARVPDGAGRWLLVAWGAATLLTLGAIGATHHRFRRQRRGWPAAELLGQRVRVSPEVGPVVMGVARPEIVVPRWLLLRPAEESRLVLAHESEHIRARDPLLLTLAWAVAALLAWNPAAWWMVARLRLAVELDCDARVLRRGESARSYGSVLIDLAGRSRPMRAGMLALADPPSQLERRLLAMTHQRTRSALARGLALGGLALLALGAACAAELPTAAEIQALDVAAAEQAGGYVALLDTPEGTVYRLDGVVVTRAEALALAPEKIARMGITRARTPGERSEVAILSRKVEGEVVAVGEGIRIRGTAPVNGEPVAMGSFSVRRDGPVGPEPVYIVDGDRRANALASLAPNSIESIHVIKDRDAAVKIAGPDAVNGLIVIRTKGGKPDGLELDAVPPPVAVQIRDGAVRTLAGPPPVYFIDGVRSTEAAFHALDPQRIESINVFKGALAVDRIGPDGANGVVEAVTKK